MRRSPLYGAACAVVLAVVAACYAREQAPTSHEHHEASPGLAFVNDPSRVDTSAAPDLIVDASATTTSWRVKDEEITQGLCSAEEGNVQPGKRRLLRFTVTTPNVGQGDV